MKKKMTPTKDRPSTMISIRMPVDVVEKLKQIAPSKGMSGYQALIKYYVGKGLREDSALASEIERSHRIESALSKFGLKSDQVAEFWKEIA